MVSDETEVVLMEREILKCVGFRLTFPVKMVSNVELNFGNYSILLSE